MRHVLVSHVTEGPTIHTVAIIARKGVDRCNRSTGDFLFLQQRSMNMKAYPGLWETPGGKVEPADIADEDRLATIRRELTEELGESFVRGLHFDGPQFARGVYLFEKEKDVFEYVRWCAFLAFTTVAHMSTPEIDRVAVAGFGLFPIDAYSNLPVTPITQEVITALRNDDEFSKKLHHFDVSQYGPR
jgi:8-oxo-dGTP pyrophosphatase MutT (NUDIX family)